jgi:hypothetical protein
VLSPVMTAEGEAKERRRTEKQELKNEQIGEWIDYRLSLASDRRGQGEGAERSQVEVEMDIFTRTIC